MENEHFKMEQFNKEVLLGNATWWQMELPSGEVIFGENKARMLGYEEGDFKVYQDFMVLVHPEDQAAAMQAMRDHMSGKAKVYEIVYRIKTKGGEYIKFYDCGQIIKKENDQLVVTGFVMKIAHDDDVLKQMESFKELIINGKPSIIDLVANIK